MKATQQPDEAGLSHLTDQIVAVLKSDTSKKSLQQLVSVARRSLRLTRHGVTVSGKGLSDVLLYLAPRLPVRDRSTLAARFGETANDRLAEQVIIAATRASAGVGGTTGALATVSEFMPPAWLALPVEIIVETLLVAAVELRLIAELHELYGENLGDSENARGEALLRIWSDRKGVDLHSLGSASPALSAHGAKAVLMRAIRRRLITRAAKNVSSLTPLLVGAVLGAETNRRSTRSLGVALKAELARKHR